MENTKIVELLSAAGEIIEYVIIDKGNDEYVSMPKAIYDESLKDAAK